MPVPAPAASTAAAAAASEQPLPAVASGSFRPALPRDAKRRRLVSNRSLCTAFLFDPSFSFSPFPLLMATSAGTGERRACTRRPALHARDFDRHAAAAVGPTSCPSNRRLRTPTGSRAGLPHGSGKQARQERPAGGQGALSPRMCVMMYAHRSSGHRSALHDYLSR
jgi:hypothetical protein